MMKCMILVHLASHELQPIIFVIGDIQTDDQDTVEYGAQSLVTPG